MPYKDPEKRKAYLKEWKKNNPDKMKNYQIDQIDYQKEYKKSEKGIKSQKKSNWKNLGIKDNLDDLYKIYKDCEKCIICDNAFKNPKDKHLNHCHETGYFLNILCMKCNIHEHHPDYFKL